MLMNVSTCKIHQLRKCRIAGSTVFRDVSGRTFASVLHAAS